VTFVLTRGICTEKRELTNIITEARMMKRQSKCGAGNHLDDARNAKPPAMTISHR
jgi:hypothetical protein